MHINLAKHNVINNFNKNVKFGINDRQYRSLNSIEGHAGNLNLIKVWHLTKGYLTSGS